MLNTIDLFVGCGGLSEGFEQSRKYKMIGAVEWEPSPVKELRNHLKNRLGINDAEERVLQFDIQRTEELFNGWEDEKFGRSKGLDALVGSQQLDVIIGGPPCQAYSVAGRIRDEHGMREDYRNYLFESYLEVVQHYKPKVFVFENVPGILSAKPGDGSVKIIDLIQKAFADAGYVVLPNLSNAIIDMTEYGVPQNRKRIIILGVSKAYYAIYEGIITEIEKEIKKLCERDIDEIDTVIEDTVTAKAQSGDVDEMANLFNSVSFRDFVMTGYKNKCAITGNVIRYGSFMNLEAAHIWPRSHKGLYLPSNGIALCRDMHWAFDKGMFTIDDNFKVIVHPEVESNYLKKYNRKSLFIPENAFFRPDINNLHYHQTHIYGLFKTSGSLVKAAGYYGNTASVVSMVAEGKGSYGSNSNN